MRAPLSAVDYSDALWEMPRLSMDCKLLVRSVEYMSFSTMNLYLRMVGCQGGLPASAREELTEQLGNLATLIRFLEGHGSQNADSTAKHPAIGVLETALPVLQKIMQSAALQADADVFAALCEVRHNLSSAFGSSRHLRTTLNFGGAACLRHGMTSQAPIVNVTKSFCTGAGKAAVSGRQGCGCHLAGHPGGSCAGGAEAQAFLRPERHQLSHRSFL